MNPASKSSLPVALDPVATAILAQLKEKVATQEQALSEKDAQLMRAQQALTLSELKIQKLVEELRLERIKKYGKQSEKLSDLQLQLLDIEPAVSSDEIESEIASGPLPEQGKADEAAPQRKRKPHPGRNVELVDPRDQVAQAPNVCGAAMANDGVSVADSFFPQPALSELQPGRAHRVLVWIVRHASQPVYPCRSRYGLERAIFY